MNTCDGLWRSHFPSAEKENANFKFDLFLWIVAERGVPPKEQRREYAGSARIGLIASAGDWRQQKPLIILFYNYVLGAKTISYGGNLHPNLISVCAQNVRIRIEC